MKGPIIKNLQEEFVRICSDLKIGRKEGQNYLNFLSIEHVVFQNFTTKRETNFLLQIFSKLVFKQFHAIKCAGVELKLSRTCQLVRIMYLSAKWASLRNFSAVANVIKTLPTSGGTPGIHMKELVLRSSAPSLSYRYNDR